MTASHRRRILPALSLLTLASLLLECSGRPHVEPPPADLGVVAGRVIKGPINGATVTVYRLEGTHRGAVAGTATTDGDGAFRVAVGTSTGPFLVAATGGTFVDEATGVTVPVNSAELTALIPAFDVETKLETVRVTPLSHLAAGLALFWTEAEGQSLAAADAEAWQHINGHFGGLDWRTATPTDLPAAPGVNLDEAARAGLILAALSMEARLVAEADGLTPGGRVNPLPLTRALYDDVSADGFFDGLGPNGARLVLPQGGLVTDAGPTATALNGQTARTALAQGVAKYLASDRNPTHITLADAQQLITALATDADARIFRDGAGPADVEPPVITFTRPAEGAGVHGAVDVEVRALDNVAVASVAFTAPAALVSTVATPTADGKSSVLHAILDVSALPDGPVEVAVRALDTSRNEATKTLHLAVSNHGPVITVTAPAEGAMVRGVVALSATATAQAGSVSKLELRTPPAGVGADGLPSASDFGATWNTLLAPEGPVPLVFHAEDTLGGTTDFTVNVTVDNVPFGTVHTVVTLGAPVQGLGVRLVAIDDATGQPVLGRPGGATLGQATALTDADGGVSFSLSQENYEGPAQLVASGTAATYVDPSDSATTIALPASFSASSYVAHYKTGDALDVPVTGWTTLADAAALAWAQGHNPAQPTPVALVASLRVVDPFFPAHLTRPQSWAFRAAYPVALTVGTQSMRDVTFAAMPDVALNQLARDLAGDVGLTPGTGFALPQLLEALRQDLADGQWDGRAGSLQLATGGTTPYAFDANTTRFRLAIGLDRFIRSSANRTGLTRQDLQTSGVYDNITGDTCALYPASQPPIPFDNQPPTVTWTVTFTNGGQAAMPLVAVDGGMPLAAGVLSVRADATDMSGVASLAVAVGGSPLTPGPGSTTAHFVSTLDSTTAPDGTVTFAATACDRLGNCGPATFVVATDNTPPAVTPVAPAAGFYSAAMNVEGLATDAHGLASFGVAGVAGLVDQDAAMGRVYAPAASWTLPAGQVDGPLPLTFSACDVVRNCATATLTPTIDRTPPTVTVTGVPPYTNGSSVTLTVTASDGAGAGVARVLASLSGGAPVSASRSGTSWTLTLGGLGVGSNLITVWAEDAASPSNSGAAHSAPYQQALTVLRDTLPPNVFTRAGSYRDERGMTVSTDAQGRPVMPVQYLYAGAPVAVGEGSTVYKIRSKAGAADGNVPFLRWAVQQEAPGTTSPLASATYQVTGITASSTARFCSSRAPCPSGSLRLSTATEAGFDLYELPLHLGTIESPGTISYAITFTDAAGNATVRNFSVTYVFVGAPIVVVQDTAYGTYGDAQSVYPYSTSLGYPSLIGSTRRVVRWLAFNPNQETVWASLAHSGFSGTWTETWWEDTTSRYLPPGDLFTDDGISAWDYADWFSKLYTNTAWASECVGTWNGQILHGQGPFPCTASAAGGDSQPTHYLGDTASTRCEPVHTHQWAPGTLFGTTNTVAMTPGLQVLANPLPTGGETTAAATATFPGAGAAWVIPPATATSAGALAVYGTVTTPARATGGLAVQRFPLAGSGPQSFRAGYTYLPTALNSQLACHVCRGFACLTVDEAQYNQGWTGYYFDWRMRLFGFGYAGSLVLASHADLNDTIATATSTWPSPAFSTAYSR